NGCLYSVFACATWIAMLKRRSRQGRDARIRSCAFLSVEAAPNSMALGILRVLCTLLILPRISLELGMVSLRAPPSERSGLLEVRDRRGERLLVVGSHFLRRLDALVSRRVLALHERAQRGVER